MQIYLQGLLVNESSIVNLKYGMNYTLSCTATDSRPGVLLNFVDSNSVTLESYSNIVSNVTRINLCDDKQFCSTSLLSLNIAINDSRLLTLTSIKCTAVNSTSPYDINISTDISVNVINNGKFL